MGHLSPSPCCPWLGYDAWIYLFRLGCPSGHKTTAEDDHTICPVAVMVTRRQGIMLARCEPWQRRRTDDEVISSPSSHTGTRSGDRQGCLSPPPLITYMASLQLSAGLGAVLTTRHHHSDCVSTGAVDPSSPQPTPLTRLFLEAALRCSGQGVVTVHSRATIQCGSSGD